MDPITEYGRRAGDAVRYGRMEPQVIQRTGIIAMPEDLRSSPYGPGVEAHEYRHLGIMELRQLYNDNPAEFIYRFGRDAYDKVGALLDEAGGPFQNRGQISAAQEEKFVELFDPPFLDEYARPTDPFSKAGIFGVITEKTKSSDLQSPELREGVLAALRGDITEEELAALPTVDRVSEYLRTEAMKSQQRPEPTEFTYGETGRYGKMLPDLERVSDVRGIVSLMKELDPILKRLPSPRPVTGKVRPEQDDSEQLLRAYKDLFGTGYSSFLDMDPEDAKAEVTRLSAEGKKLGSAISRDFINPMDFDRKMFPTKKFSTGGLVSLKREYL